MKKFFLLPALFILPLLTAADFSEKLTPALWSISSSAIGENLPGFVQGNEKGTFYRLGGEERAEIGEFSCGEALASVLGGKLMSLNFIAYRKLTAEKPLGEAEFAELSRTAQTAFGKIFPKQVAKLADHYQSMTVSGRIFSGECGEMALCEVRMGKQPEALVVGIFRRGETPRQLSAYVREVLDLRYLSTFDAESNASIYMIPAGEAGVKDMGLSSTAARLALFYGVKFSQKTAQDCVGDDGKDAASTIRLFRTPRRMEVKCGITCREVMDGENLMTKKKRDALEKDYDRVVRTVNKKSHERDRAKRKKEMDLDDEDDELKIFPSIDPEIFIQARAVNKSGFNRFLREVSTSLERGNPLLWCVMEFKTDKAGKAQAGAPKLTWKILCGISMKEKKMYFVDCYTHPEPTEITFDEAWAITLKLYQMAERK